MATWKAKDNGMRTKSVFIKFVGGGEEHSNWVEETSVSNGMFTMICRDPGATTRVTHRFPMSRIVSIKEH